LEDFVEDVKQRAMTFVDQNAALIRQLALDIHAHPEPNYQEVYASTRATALLDEFACATTLGVAELPTAFTATIQGAGDGPHIGLVAEYDCVPDVGHGCGHNLICAATVAAGLGLQWVAGELPGTITVFGTPAEEGGKGKMHMAAKGVFDGLDAALQFHPATCEGVTSINMMAQNLFFTFTGHPAHTTAAPWEGRNALDAVIATFNGVNALRQQLHPDLRITGIITESPTTIASIPERAAAMFRVRGFVEDRVLEAVGRVKRCAEGAALATDTTLELGDEAIEPALRCSEVLGDVLQREAGRFGLDCSARSRGSGTTDLAYVGQVAPTLMFGLGTWPVGTPGHSQAAVEASRSIAALDKTLVAAKILIGMSIDLLTQPDLLERAGAEFAMGPGAASRSGELLTMGSF
jgi:amidohydrolase